jgi:hypothetical protein
MNRMTKLTEKFLSDMIVMRERIGVRFFRSVYDQPMPLGRWNLVYDDRIDARIERANEDHCGPCGELAAASKVNHHHHHHVQKVFERKRVLD